MKKYYHLPIPIRLLSGLIFCFSGTFLPLKNAFAQPSYTIEVKSGGFSGSECIQDPKERINGYLVGMTGELVVCLYFPDSVPPIYTGVKDWTWPQGLVIEAGLSEDTISAHFQPSATVLNQLNLRYFVSEHQARTDSLWRHAGREIPSTQKRADSPKFWFLLNVPEAAAGKYLGFRAHLENSRYGNLTSGVSFSRGSAPCSKADSDMVHVGNIFAAADARNDELALAIIDSLLNSGWVNFRALGIAKMSALKLNRWDDLLRYFDLQYQRFGTTEPDGSGHDTPESYERTRQKILIRKAEYEQQQHQR